MKMRRTLGILALLVAPMALAGCESEGTIQVTGALLKGGSPYKAPSGQTLGITFYALEVVDTAGKSTGANNQPYAALVNPDAGTFRVPGPEGRGIPRGKYRVSVIQKLTREALETARPPRGLVVVDRDTDLLRDAFGPERSPIVRELTSSCDLAIDLEHPGEATPQR